MVDVFSPDRSKHPQISLVPENVTACPSQLSNPTSGTPTKSQCLGYSPITNSQDREKSNLCLNDSEESHGYGVDSQVKHSRTLLTTTPYVTALLSSYSGGEEVKLQLPV